MSRRQSYQVGEGDQHPLSIKGSHPSPEPLISLGADLGLCLTLLLLLQQIPQPG